MMLHSDAEFATHYESSVTEEITDGEQEYVFERPQSGASAVGLTWMVRTQSGRQWRGVVRAGRPPVRGAITGIFGTPDPITMCAIANGDAFLINSEDPATGQYIGTGGPVVIVAPAIKDDVLLLASPWVVTAVCAEGRTWQTRRLSVEGLRLDEIADGWLRGVSDPDEEEARNFAVNLRTGESRGGFRRND
jgi:hypothetical protein